MVGRRPRGGGTHLVSDMSSDAQGRTLEIQGPAHEVQTAEPISGVTQPRTLRTCQFFLYDDPGHIQISAAGYREGAEGTAAANTVGALAWSRSDAAGRGIEDRLIQRPSGMDAWPPQSGESMTDRSRWLRWTRRQFDASGLLEWVRVYHLIPSSGDGAARNGINPVVGQHEDAAAANALRYGDAAQNPFPFLRAL